MRKLSMAVGAAIGFLAGSRAGREPYEKLEGKARSIARRPDVRKLVDETSDTVHQKLHDAQDAASAKIHHVKAS